MKLALFISLALFGFQISNSQNTGSISGTVVDKMTQQKVPYANAMIKGTNKAVATDSIGYFQITGIPFNTYTIVISSIGYKNQTLFNIVISAGNELNITVELEPEAQQLQAIIIKASRGTVRAATLETPLSVQRLTSEEIKSNPGSNFDISKVIQTLPGVGGGSQSAGCRFLTMLTHHSCSC